MALTLPNSKVCSRCGLDKPLEAFGRWSQSRDGRKPDCRQCRKVEAAAKYATLSPEERRALYERQKVRKVSIQQEISKYLRTTGCTDCGEDDPVVLEFDHVRGVKVDNVSTLIVLGNRERLWEEIEKCEVVCANCHRRRTALRQGWYV